MALGNILRTAREQQGLTTSQVADATHMLAQVVEELEREDFRRFAAAIYGRGFVRLYAEYLGIDPLPLVKEFGELYAGARRPQIATRVLQTLPETPAQPAAAAAAPAPPAPTELKPLAPAELKPLAPAELKPLAPAELKPLAPAPAAAPPAPATARRAPAEPEAAEEIFAPAQQEVSTARATPDNDASGDRGPDLDLFTAMASHAFGGEPVHTPTRKEPRPAATATLRQPVPEESPARPALAGAVLGQDQTRTPRLAGHLAGWLGRVTDILPAPCRDRPLLSAVAALLLLALLIAGAFLLTHRTPATTGTTAMPIANAAPPATDIRLLPPPETYVD
jgi:transcriptional regulator with XRE-family HTH domain